MFILQGKKLQGKLASWIKAQSSCRGVMQQLIHPRTGLTLKMKKLLLQSWKMVCRPP